MSEAEMPLVTGRSRGGLAEQIQAVLTDDTRVGASLVTLETDADGAMAPLVWMVPAATWIAPARAKAEAGQTRMAVKLWARVFDTAYFGETDQPVAPGFAGWTSSLTGAPFPPADMALWRDHTVERILELRPRHVLEVGCGLGLLLEKIAPHCASYRATDISAEAISRLQAWAATQDRLRHVQVAQRAAHELDDLEPGSVDTVIINSVVQYFPDFGYLARVLAAILPLLSPDGQVFVGDVRDSRLLGVFNAAVSLARAEASETAAGLRRAIHAHVETELAIAPRAFFELPGYRVTHTLLKQAGADNELTRYRYDVVLRAGPAPHAARLTGRKWDATADSATRLPLRLAGDPAPVLLRGIVNARLHADLAAAELIRTAPAGKSVEALRAELTVMLAQPHAGQDPAALVRAAEQRGQRARAVPDVAPDCFSLLLSDPALAEPEMPPPETPAFDALASGTPGMLASDPLLARLAAPLIAALKAELADLLPHATGLAFVAVPALPSLG